MGIGFDNFDIGLRAFGRDHSRQRPEAATEISDPSQAPLGDPVRDDFPILQGLRMLLYEQAIQQPDGMMVECVNPFEIHISVVATELIPNSIHTQPYLLKGRFIGTDYVQ